MLSKKFFLILVGIFGEISSLIFVYFIKYRTHNLSIENLNLSFCGNIINLLLSAIVILFLILSLIRVKKIRLLDIQIYLNSLFLSVLLLLILVILLSKDFYVLSMIKSDEYEFEKSVSVTLWIIFFIVKLFGTNFLIMKFFSIKRGLYPKIFILISITFGLILSVAFVRIFMISRTGMEYQIRKGDKFDAIVILGAAVWKGNIPSPLYEGRLNTALELFENGFSNKIVLTGSNAPFELSEAKVGEIYLRNRGVNSTKIEIEEKSTSTIEQVHFIKRDLIERKNYQKLLVVSDAFHLPRVIEISKFLSVDFKVARSNFKIELINNIWYRIREAVLLAIFWLFAV